jgi:hypothetical protein
MISIYIASVLFGGVLLGASLSSGHHGDGDGGGDGGDGAANPAGYAGHEGHHDHPQHHDGRLPFLSLRFWAFASAFFGLSGALLTIAGAAGAVVPLLAGGVGTGAGLISARILGNLGRRPTGLLGDARSHVGREGRVLLPVGPGQRGKIRLSIGGISTDLVAETDSETRLEPGSTALLVGLRDNVAIVELSPAGAAAPSSDQSARPALRDQKDKQEKS